MQKDIQIAAGHSEASEATELEATSYAALAQSIDILRNIRSYQIPTEHCSGASYTQAIVTAKTISRYKRGLRSHDLIFAA